MPQTAKITKSVFTDELREIAKTKQIFWNDQNYGFLEILPKRKRLKNKGKLELCYLNYVEIHEKIISPQNQFSIQGKSNKTTFLTTVRKIESVNREKKGIKCSRG